MVLYRPHPVPASIFFQEFSAFPETTVLCPEVLLISGDFNFHLDDSSDDDASKFMELMCLGVTECIRKSVREHKCFVFI